MSGKNRIATPYQYEMPHKKPMTRRDLLGQGFLSFGAYMAMPSFLAQLSDRAMGAEGDPACKTEAAGGRMIPFLIFDLAGGANIAGTNVWVGGQGGQDDVLPAGSYATIGLTAAQAPGAVQPNKEMGLYFHPASKMLQGIKEVAGAATLANVEGALFCTASNDDTRNNPHNPLYWVAKSGLTGQLVSLVGTSAGPSGGRAAAPATSIDPSRTPSVITAPADALNLVDPGKLATLLSAGDVKKILAATKTMSDARLRQFQTKDVPSQIQDLIKCGYINSDALLTQFTPASLDATQDANVTATFGRFAANRDEPKAAAIAKLVLQGYAGAGVIELGGYDYHGQGRATQDTRDLDAGRMIGSALELAALKQTPVMIYVYTDGGVSAQANGAAPTGILPFSADSGERSAAFTLVYRPGTDGKTGMVRDGRRQIGAFKAGGSVDTTANKISSSVELLGKAVVANYLALHGKEGNLSKVVGDDPFGAELEKYLAFAKIV